METAFTPVHSLLGGALIGLAAVLFMWLHGRIAGISGIVSRLLPPGLSRAEIPMSAAFVVGLLAAWPLYSAIRGEAPESTLVASSGVLVLAGIITGFGAALGSGCTSGHGVCGISRLSTRSIVATLTFMLTAFLTVFITRHLLAGGS